MSTHRGFPAFTLPLFKDYLDNVGLRALFPLDSTAQNYQEASAVVVAKNCKDDNARTSFFLSRLGLDPDRAALSLAYLYNSGIITEFPAAQAEDALRVLCQPPFCALFDDEHPRLLRVDAWILKMAVANEDRGIQKLMELALGKCAEGPVCDDMRRLLTAVLSKAVLSESSSVILTQTMIDLACGVSDELRGIVAQESEFYVLDDSEADRLTNSRTWQLYSGGGLEVRRLIAAARKNDNVPPRGEPAEDVFVHSTETWHHECDETTADIETELFEVLYAKYPPPVVDEMCRTEPSGVANIAADIVAHARSRTVTAEIFQNYIVDEWNETSAGTLPTWQCMLDLCPDLFIDAASQSGIGSAVPETIVAEQNVLEQTVHENVEAIVVGQNEPTIVEEAIVVGQNYAEQNIVEAVVVGQNHAEQKIVEAVVVGQNHAEENIVKENIVKENIVEENIVEENILEENIVEENIVEENIVEENIVKENIVEENIVKENIVEENIVKENIVEENEAVGVPENAVEQGAVVEYTAAFVTQDPQVTEVEDSPEITDGITEDGPNVSEIFESQEVTRRVHGDIVISGKSAAHYEGQLRVMQDQIDRLQQDNAQWRHEMRIERNMAWNAIEQNHEAISETNEAVRTISEQSRGYAQSLSLLIQEKASAVMQRVDGVALDHQTFARSTQARLSAQTDQVKTLFVRTGENQEAYDKVRKRQRQLSQSLVQAVGTIQTMADTVASLEEEQDGKRMRLADADDIFDRIDTEVLSDHIVKVNAGASEDWPTIDEKYLTRIKYIVAGELGKKFPDVVKKESHKSPWLLRRSKWAAFAKCFKPTVKSGKMKFTPSTSGFM